MRPQSRSSAPSRREQRPAKERKKFEEEKSAKLKHAAEQRVLAVTLSHEILHLSERHFAMRIQVNAKAAVEVALRLVQEKVSRGDVPRNAKDVLALLKDAHFSTEALVALGSAAGLTAASEVLGHPLLLEQELTSDCKGAELLGLIGSNPEDAVVYWKRKAKKGDGILFKAHPGSAERAKELSRCLPKTQPTEKPMRVAQRGL